MADITEIDIAGLEGNTQAQPRVFAHEAIALTVPTTGQDAFVYVVKGVGNTPVNGDKISTLSRGACLYVGVGGNIDVQMESGNRVLFTGVASGSFLPIQVIGVYGTDSAGTATTTAGSIIALF
jgi:hypothetical protein